MSGKTVEQKCHCGATFHARNADVKRGWGKFCSKSCKAKEQESRTGQFSNVLHRAREFRREELHSQDHLEPWDDHKS